MKILEAKRSINQETYQPEVVVTISLPLTPTVEGLTKEEQYRLVGREFFDAWDAYKEKNG
jgi:hypothetical protein